MNHVTYSILLLTVCSVTAYIQVSVDISETYVMPNDNITVVCRMTGGDSGTAVFMYKAIQKSDGNRVQAVISTNDILTPLYSKLPRFKVDKSDAGTAILYILHIYGVSVNDSGHYGCYANEESDVFDSEELIVYRLPSHVYFTNYTEDASIIFDEGQPMEVECNVDGVVPKPEVKVTVGGTDYAEKFQTITELQSHCEGSSGQKELCPLHFSYNVTLYNSKFLPDDLSDGDTLLCQVIIPDSGYMPKPTRLNVDYRFSPKFECDRTQYAYPHQMDFHMSCIVTYKPRAYDFVWNFMVDGMEYELRPQSGGYESDQFKVIQEEVTDTSSKISLVFKEVDRLQYTDYHLTVYQEHGNNTVDITLEEPKVTPSAAVTVMSSTIVFIITSLITIWQQQF